MQAGPPGAYQVLARAVADVECGAERLPDLRQRRRENGRVGLRRTDPGRDCNGLEIFSNIELLKDIW